MSATPQPFIGVCEGQARDLLKGIATIELSATITGTVSEDVDYPDCTPTPRTYTMTITSDALSQVWGRKNVYGNNTAPDEDEFSLFQFACSKPKDLFTLVMGAASGSAGNVYQNCFAPEVVCPGTTHAEVDQDSTKAVSLELSIGYNADDDAYELTMAANLSPALGGCPTDSISQFVKNLTGLSRSAAMTGRSESVVAPIGDGNITCVFTLAFS